MKKQTVQVYLLKAVFHSAIGGTPAASDRSSAGGGKSAKQTGLRRAVWSGKSNFLTGVLRYHSRNEEIKNEIYKNAGPGK